MNNNEMEVQPVPILQLGDVMEVKFLKSILGYASKDMVNWTVVEDHNYRNVIMPNTILGGYSFGKGADHFQQQTERYNDTKQECRLLFNPWIVNGLHFVFYTHPQHKFQSYCAFFLQTDDKELIPFRCSRNKGFHLWLNLYVDTTFYAEFKVFMQENMQNMKKKQLFLKHQMDADDYVFNIPAVLYGIIAEYVIGFV